MGVAVERMPSAQLKAGVQRCEEEGYVRKSFFKGPPIALGAIFILRKDIGVGGWSRKWQFFITLCSENVLT